jgi:polar amino acid transport system substrate-binding protein
MKKMLVLLLTGVMAFNLVACGSSSSTTETAAETDEAEAAETEETEEPEEAEETTSGESRLDAILEAGKIVVCTSPDYAPYEFEDPSKSGQDKYVGADMELARYIADQLGVELEISAMDFDACLAAIGAGRVDLGLIGMVPKEERLTLMDFTDVYYNDGEQYVVVMKDRLEEFPDMASFAGKTVAAQNGTLQAQLVTEQIPDANMEIISKVTDGILMLQTGKVDGIAVASVVANNLVANNDDLAIAPEAFEYTSLGVVGGVPKDEPELLDKLNEIIEGVIDSEIYYEWIDDANALAAEMQ